MKTYSFSPSRVAFYANALRETHYEPLNAWPDDAVELDDDSVAEFMTVNPPSGKVLGAIDGRPAWVDIPPPSDEQVISFNKSLFANYNAQAIKRIDILTDATDHEIMGDDILPDDVELLKKWRAYRVKLSRITDFLNPSWPEMPE